MFVLDTELFKDPITEPSYFGTFNQISGYATKNTREDTCSFLSQSKFCGFALFLHLIMFCKQLHNGDSHWGWKGPLKSSSPTFLLKHGQLHPARFAASSQRLHDLSCFPLSVSSSGQMQFCVVLFVPIVSPPVTGYYWEEFGFLLFFPLHQVYSDKDKDPSEPPDLTSSETEQLSHIFSGSTPAWSPLSSCLSVITPTDPTICLNYWSLFSLTQLFNTGKYPQWLSSAI